jgi:hypothetical protein
MMMKAEIASEMTKSLSHTASTGQERGALLVDGCKASITMLDWLSFPTEDILP